MTYINHLHSFIYDKLPIIQRKHLYVGVPRDNKFMTMVALVQEYGAHIQAKNYPFLWIPTKEAQGRKASEIPNLYVRQRQGSDSGVAGYDDDDYPYGFCVCFVLKKSVDIPARAFIRKCVDNNLQEWSVFITLCMNGVMVNEMSLDEFFEAIGVHVRDSLKQTIIKFSNPPNAPLTQERKGMDNPLINTGHLRDAITYEWI